MFNFVADRVIKGRIYPSLAQWEARPYTQAWREFGEHWPFTTPLRIQEYCNQHDYPINVFGVEDQLPENTYYPICLGFFDFSIDYFSLLDFRILESLQNKRLKILFMYHEGDNPEHIKSRLDHLCQSHGVDSSCYVFVSANTACQKLPGFVYFNDFELWYFQRNIEQPALEIHQSTRQKDFTVLSRAHKWWRLAVMSDLKRLDVLTNSYWSYCHSPVDDNNDDCPIEIDAIAQLRWHRDQFMTQIPYFCDDLPDNDRNNHSITIEEFYANAYGNIVLESQFDVDGSGGAFLTEKTFKPIKHGQFFFIAGGPGSLQALRDLGYRVFDDVLDNSYDLETNATRRWLKLRNSILSAKKSGVDNIFSACLNDIQHNQNLFCQSKIERLNILSTQINEQHS